MELESLCEQIISLARAQFGEAGEGISKDSTAADVASWNSLSHLMFLTSIESTYGIKFDLLKMAEMKSIGDIAAATFEAIQ